MTADEIKIQIGKNIKEARLAKGVTQQQLADAIKTTKGNISKMENGKYTIPSVPTLLKIADNLNVPVEYLVKNLL